MNITSGLSIAAGGLANTQRQLALLAHNVSNADTSGYIRQLAVQSAITADGTGIGVRSGPAIRDVDVMLQQDLWAQSSIVAQLETKRSALSKIDAMSGAPGAGEDLSSKLGAVREAFARLEVNPADQAAQRAVVNASITLADTINRMAESYQQQRQLAHDSIHEDVMKLNFHLADIGDLTNRIIRLKSSGESTADLENQRDTVIHKISNQIQIRVLNRPDGDLQLLSTTGLLLPIHAEENPFSLQTTNIQAGAWYPGGGVPGIMLGGVDVSRQFSVGRIAGNLDLRDTVLPTFQAALDEFSKTLTERFDTQGLTLFTDPSGNTPVGGGVPIQSGYTGYSLTIQVNASVSTNAALVRDGTHAVVGNPAGAASFIPNPVGGPAGFATMILRVADNVFGRDVQTNVMHAPISVTGLGADGSLHLSFGAPATLTDYATDLIAMQATEAASVSDQQESAGAVRDVFQTRLDERAGVDMDSEMALMVQLQNAYAANARVIAAVQAMWDQLLGSVR